MMGSTGPGRIVSCSNDIRPLIDHPHSLTTEEKMASVAMNYGSVIHPTKKKKKKRRRTKIKTKQNNKTHLRCHGWDAGRRHYIQDIKLKSKRGQELLNIYGEKQLELTSGFFQSKVIFNV